MMMHFTVILSKPPFYYPHIYLNFIVESGEIVLLPTSSCHISLHVSNPYIYLTQGSQPSDPFYLYGCPYSQGFIQISYLHSVQTLCLDLEIS